MSVHDGCAPVCALVVTAFNFNACVCTCMYVKVEWCVGVLNCVGACVCAHVCVKVKVDLCVPCMGVLKCLGACVCAPDIFIDFILTTYFWTLIFSDMVLKALDTRACRSIAVVLFIMANSRNR